MLHYRELLQSLQSIGSHHSDTKEEPIFYHLNYYSIQILYFIKFLESNCFYRIYLQTIYIIVSFIYTHVHSKWFFPSYTQWFFSISATTQFFLCSLLYWHFALLMPRKHRAFLLSILKAKNLQDGQYISFLLPHYPQNSRKDTYFYLQWRQQKQTQAPTQRLNFPSSPTTVWPQVTLSLQCIC